MVQPMIEQLPQRIDWSQIPHIDQYLGPWAIREDAFNALLHRARTLDLHLHFQSEDVQQAQARAAAAVEYQVVGNVAMIPLNGTLMKHESSLSGGSGTVNARRKIRAAAKNPDISSILLHIESPGGTAAGTKELADEVAEARKLKTVWAYCEDLCCSAAYWIASQAEKVFANGPAMIGSIGTYMAIADWSKLYEDAGVKVHVIRAGAFKGVGTMGTEITDEHLAEFQRLINQTNDFFLKAVARGRGLSSKRVQELADGRVHLASDAQALGLIDGVQSLDQTLSQLSKVKRMTTSNAEHATPPVQEQPKAATLQEIRSACPGADNDFVVSQLERGATVAQAQQAWMQEMQQRLQTQTEELNKLKQQAETPPRAASKLGVPPLTSTGTKADAADTDPIAAWNTAVAEQQKLGKSKAAAIQAVVRANPELHQAYIEAYNAAHRRSIR